MSFTGLTPSFIKSLIANMELDTDVHYFGDKDTNGSWRVIRDSGTLKIQERVAGVWTLRFDASTGSGATTLDGLSDVNTAGSADGDVLTFNSATSQWLPAAPTGGGGTAIPTSSTFKTTSYTIPVGKWAKVVPLDSTPVVFSGTGALNASAIPKWTINSTTVYAGNATAIWANNSAGVNLTLPTECMARFSVLATTLNTVTNGVLSVGGFALAQLQSFSITRQGFLSCTGQTVNFNVTVTLPSFVFHFFTLKPTNLVVRAGDVLSGSSNFRWLVQEFDV